MTIRSAQFMKSIMGTDEILADGIPQIAFIGRSNVGKSSVINSLVNQKDLAKVGKKPGKTRTINFFKINKQFYLVDLPGYGYAKVGPEERERIRKLILWYLTYSGARPAVIALILDVKVGLTEFDKEVLRTLRESGHRYLIIANKSDKLGPQALIRQTTIISSESGGEDIFPYSAKKRSGADKLFQRLFVFIDSP